MSVKRGKEDESGRNEFLKRVPGICTLMIGPNGDEIESTRKVRSIPAWCVLGASVATWSEKRRVWEWRSERGEGEETVTTIFERKGPKVRHSYEDRGRKERKSRATGKLGTFPWM